MITRYDLLKYFCVSGIWIGSNIKTISMIWSMRNNKYKMSIKKFWKIIEWKNMKINFEVKMIYWNLFLVMVRIKIGLELWSRKFSRILNFNTLNKRKGISEYFLSVYSTLFLYIPWFLLDFYLNVRCNKISNKPTCWWATNIKANFVFTSIGVFGNLKKMRIRFSFSKL